MSRQRPRGLQQGSRRWWRATMKAWSDQIGAGVPKNHRKRRWSARETYARPAWSGLSPRYGSWK